MQQRPALTIDMVRDAADRIAPYVHRTPVLRCRGLDELAGAALWLKAENLQRTGSFKTRGAFNAMLSMGAHARRGGVVAVSSGNHAQAVALSAHELGTGAVIVIPSDANPTKLAAAQGYGAEIVSEGVTEANRDEIVLRLVTERGLPLIHPYDDLQVMAGQGTVGIEVAEQAPDASVVVVPVGGGGLISGVATAVKSLLPSAKVVGVEPEDADDARRSLRAGRRIALDATPSTIVDGVRAPSLGRRAWTVISSLVDDIVAVSDTEALAAMELIWTRAKSVVEPAAAMPLAAVLSGKVRGTRIVLVMSGGNVDLDGWCTARHSTTASP